MKKIIILATMTALAMLSFGCAMTDYGNNNAQWTALASETNTSDEGLGCIGTANGAPSDRQDGTGTKATAVTSVVASMKMLAFNTTAGPIAATSACNHSGSFNPLALTDAAGDVLVGAKQAKDWMSPLGTYAFVQEAQVFGGPGSTGLWTMGAVNGTDCGGNPGSLIKTYGGSTGRFSCVGSQVGGLYGGGGESQLVGDSQEGELGLPGTVGGIGYSNPLWDRAIYAPETIAVDTRPGAQFGSNLQATSHGRDGTFGYSTFLGALGRFGECRLNNSKVKDSEGAADLFNGEGTKVSLDSGHELIVSLELREDGMLDASIHAVGFQGDLFHVDTPLRVGVSRDLKLIEFDLESQRGTVQQIASWALTGLPRDEGGDFLIEIDQFVEELLLDIPGISLHISGAGAERLAETGTLARNHLTSPVDLGLDRRIKHLRR